MLHNPDETATQFRPKPARFDEWWATKGHQWHHDGYMPPASKQVAREIIESFLAWSFTGQQELKFNKED